ncbi:MAG: hypothetical protein HRU19_06495 [Pseudobacteriovorax sp.]|nr:hypothetical protein [Pseudobacteriovorax sp.]
MELLANSKFPQVAALVMTAVLWYWSFKKGRVSELQECQQIRSQNKFANSSFFCLMFLQTTASWFSSASWLLASFSFATFLYFILTTSRPNQDLWSKPRSNAIAGILLFLCLQAVGLFGPHLVLIPFLAALMICHTIHKRFLFILDSNLDELKAVRAKLLHQNAQRFNTSILADISSDRNTSKIS